MIADQLKARFDIAPPKDPKDFFRILASADATCRTTLVGDVLVVNFVDGSQLRSEADGTFTASSHILRNPAP